MKDVAAAEPGVPQLQPETKVVLARWLNLCTAESLHNRMLYIYLLAHIYVVRLM